MCKLLAEMRRFARSALLCVGVAYPSSLVVLWLALRLVSEDWWLTDSLLYLPRLPLVAPLVILVPLLWVLGFRRTTYLQGVALFVWLFPLMGVVVNWPTTIAGKPSLRVLSFNVNSCAAGANRVSNAILTYNADVVLVQESESEELKVELSRVYPAVQMSTQFLIASRYPIVEVSDPEKLAYGGQRRSPRFMRYVIKSPWGMVTFFNVHPISPRAALLDLRSHARRKIMTGTLFSDVETAHVSQNGGLRQLQIETVAHLATTESNPVVVAGDTNLPGLSKGIARNFATFHDGFETVGLGLGYTYPARLRWMRLDRIFASNFFRFVNFKVGCEGVSDHLCVLGDLNVSSGSK